MPSNFFSLYLREPLKGKPMAKSAEQVSLLLGTAILPALFERLGMVDPQQIEAFYETSFYEMLRNPESGLWHMSPAALADLYQQEQADGALPDSKEQS